MAPRPCHGLLPLGKDGWHAALACAHSSSRFLRRQRLCLQATDPCKTRQESPSLAPLLQSLEALALAGSEVDDAARERLLLQGKWGGARGCRANPTAVVAPPRRTARPFSRGRARRDHSSSWTCRVCVQRRAPDATAPSRALEIIPSKRNFRRLLRPWPDRRTGKAKPLFP